jgi:NAD(P)-dependent dehydrogenase (short-subunit alcohol dehydrogenase family)
MDEGFLRSLFGLDGRVALVTGASGGIGRELARGLALAGAHVALSGRDEARLAALAERIGADGGRAEPFPADLGDGSGAEPLVAAVRARLGRLDVLVNCLGINQRQPIVEVEPETYDRIMDTNLKGVYFLSRAVAPLMREQGGGKIVHIGSVNAAVGLQDISVYGLSKAALVQTTKVMAVEWASWGIQVNCLCPGFIETELTREGLWRHERRRDWIMARLCIKRPGRPEDLVGLCLYLASSASDFTTGQTFYVDGGFLAGSPW